MGSCRCDDPFEDALDDRSNDLRGPGERARDLLGALGFRTNDPRSECYGEDREHHLAEGFVNRSRARRAATEALFDRLGVDARDRPGSVWACDRLLQACLVLLALDRYDLRLPEAVAAGDSTDLYRW